MNHLMKKFRIGSKIVSVVALLCIITSFAIGFAGFRMVTMSRTYDAVINGPAKANIFLVRADRILATIKAELYGLIAESDINEIKSLSTQVPQEMAAFHDYLEKAQTLVPEDKQKIDEIRSSFDKMQDAMKQIANLGQSDQGGIALVLYHAQIGKPLKEIQTKLVALVDDNIAHTANQTDAIATKARQMIYITVGGTAIGITLGVVIALFLARTGIVLPLISVNNAMKTLSDGQLDTVIPGTDRLDELGLMAKTLEIFRDKLVEGERLRGSQQQEQERQLKRAQQVEAAVARFEKAISSVVSTVTSSASELHSTAQSMTATADETSRQSTAVAAASAQTTQNVQTVASATEELAASIREIGVQVSEASRIIGSAVTQAAETDAKVKGLSEAAQKIGEVVGLINDIASQTNLLALNATIEAARAGEAGKGFAVVASEVKALATQTARATDEIDAQIRAIQDASTSSAQAIREIADTIRQVDKVSTAIASAVEEQGAATQEISRNVQQAALGTSNVYNNIGSVTQAVAETGQSAGGVLTAASKLARNGELLRSEVDTFLQEIRTA